MPKLIGIKKVGGGLKDGAIAVLAPAAGGLAFGPIGSAVGMMAGSQFIEDDTIKKLLFAGGAVLGGTLLVSMVLGGGAATGDGNVSGSAAFPNA